MNTYVRKPLSVEAIQYNGENANDLAEFCNGNISIDLLRPETLDGSIIKINITNNQLPLPGSVDTFIIYINSYLVKDINNQFVVYSVDEFERQYELVK